MEERRIAGDNVWFQGSLQPATVAFSDGVITRIESGKTVDVDYDYGDALILPGFIDAHTHGNNGVSTLSADEDEIARWQREIAREGVTAFAATTASAPYEKNMTVFERLSACVGRPARIVPGAEVVGIYIEGNFIDKDYRGAQDLDAIATPSVEVLRDYLQAAHDTVVRMILAVEHDEGLEVLDEAIGRGVGVSIGHSGASYSQVVEACTHGLDGVTHTYNGMASMHHRSPGIVGAAFDIASLYAEVIADGHHVSWPAIRALGRLKDDDHLVLVSDASPLKGYSGPLIDGIHIDEEGQFRTVSGALASSSMRMCDGVRNLIECAGLSFRQALQAATINPARLLHCDNRKGTLDVGKDADIVVVDHAFRVQQTYCRGIAMLGEGGLKYEGRRGHSSY